MRIIHLFAVLSVFAVMTSSGTARAQDPKSGGGDVLEVQIPRPKFEIFKAWEYGGFWRWDEKDPRFYRDFLKKIHDSLATGPF
ncbi:MAG: hypothetical protein CVU65_08845 [Deltaproteobacteria bacterium HGW-Deltaproteobacteria-22]|jgi:hypothetical protein|nr:MAG: hypothetical protein CVU65_08845 [Deltaproteobacteria bacterium HGW-Deltaproteobacteria-22]